MKANQPSCTRRQFLELGIIAGMMTVCAPESWCQADVPTTPSTILGPYYPLSGQSSGIRTSRADFQGYGVQVTDREGRFRFTTIKPGPYSFEGGTRAPHLRFQVTGRAERRVTQMFFAGELLNSQDFVLQSVPRRRENMVADFLPAPPGEDPATRLIQWDIVLRRG